MMIFDASSIINLFEQKKIEKVMNGFCLNLSIYELGNFVWKISNLYKIINLNEGINLLEALIDIFNSLNKIETKSEDYLEILKIAYKENLTFYDASYLHAAIKNNLPLVTDDEKLYTASKKYIKTLKSNEIS